MSRPGSLNAPPGVRPGSGPSPLSRREVLCEIGAAIALPAAVSSVPAAADPPGPARVIPSPPGVLPSLPAEAVEPVVRHQHTATVLPNGLLLVVGGRRR